MPNRPCGLVPFFAILGLVLATTPATGDDPKVVTERHVDWRVECTKNAMTDKITCDASVWGYYSGRLLAGSLTLVPPKTSGTSPTLLLILSDPFKLEGPLLRVDAESPLAPKLCTESLCVFDEEESAALRPQFQRGSRLLVRTRGAHGLDVTFSLRGYSAAEAALLSHQARLSPPPTPTPPQTPPVAPARDTRGTI